MTDPMTNDNPLVDPNSQFEPGDYYIPFDTGGDYGGTSKWNPFTPGQGYTDDNPDHWLKGLPILDAAHDLYDSIRDRDAFKAVADYAVTALQTVGYAAAVAGKDVGGTIVAPIVGWILEHVKPLRLVLDELTGNQDTVKAVSNTWENMSDALTEVADSYRASVNETLAAWRGEAGDTYRKGYAAALHEATEVAGMVSKIWSVVLDVVSDCVGVTHDLVRDLIAALIGQLIQDAIEAPTPAGPILIPEQTAGEIARVSSMVTTAVKMVVEAMVEGLSIADKAVGLLGKAIEHIFEGVTGG